MYLFLIARGSESYDGRLRARTLTVAGRYCPEVAILEAVDFANGGRANKCPEDPD